MAATDAIASPKRCSAGEAVEAIRDGSAIMVGGFGLVGAPLTLLRALLETSRAGRLTVISNNLGEPGRGLGAILRQGRVATAIGSYFTSSPDAGEAHAAGRLEVRLLPQGTMAEAIRAGGAGIGGFYTETGVGTALAAGREQRRIGERTYLFQEALHAD